MIKKVITLLRQSTIGTLIIGIAFITVEPAVSHAITTTVPDTFTVTQAVDSEVGFATLASNVTMSPDIGGITGGSSNGAVSVSVRTNDLLGYKMTLQASNSLGMQDVSSTTNYIPAYTTSGAGVPDYTFNTAANGFGYNVNASTTTDVPLPFRWTGTSCGGAGTTVDSTHCWMGATSTAVTIINRSTPTGFGGATTTLSFEANLIANSMLPNGNYVSTTTLTATVN
jgi:hypothetical protein